MFIPAGEYRMGSTTSGKGMSHERPVMRVRISRALYM